MSLRTKSTKRAASWPALLVSATEYVIGRCESAGNSSTSRTRLSMRASVAEGSLAPLHADAAAIYINDAAARIEASAKQALAALGEGDTLRTHLAALRRLLKVTPVDTVVRRRRLADETVRQGGYIFQ